MLQLLKSVCPRACAPHKEKSLQREAHTPQLDSSPCSPQLEKSPRSNKNPAFNCGSQALAQGPSLVAQLVKNLPTMQETRVQFLGQEDPLEEGMATHSSVLAWRIPWTEEAWHAAVHGVAKNWT